MSNACTAQSAIKAMPTASRVAAAITARRLNCRRRSSLVLNMANRHTPVLAGMPSGTPGRASVRSAHFSWSGRFFAVPFSQASNQWGRQGTRYCGGVTVLIPKRVLDAYRKYGGMHGTYRPHDRRCSGRDQKAVARSRA
jgi:hypothetical protein